tara:strand:+ start:3728 stop:4015 length:288 start_codon:yes stop_codon:yes gene_type:complete
MRKRQNRRATRSTGSRTNYFSDENVQVQSDLQTTIDKIADKVDSETGRVEESNSLSEEGTFRTVKDKNDWYLEIKTSDGWIRSADNTFVIKNKNG